VAKHNDRRVKLTECLIIETFIKHIAATKVNSTQRIIILNNPTKKTPPNNYDNKINGIIMKLLSSSSLVFLLLTLFSTQSLAVQQNQLSAEEIQQGWVLMFNGKNLDGWEIYGNGNGTGTWIVENETLKLDNDVWDIFALLGENNLIYTNKKFANFELRMDWKISEAGNSGIFWGVKSSNQGKELAMEMQVLDNDNHRDGKLYSHRAGDLYDLKAGTDGFTKPFGEWNSIRLIVKSNHIEHWMNGTKVLEINRQGEDWRERFAKSKFADRQGYGQVKAGYILLQDHWDVVWFRNIKVLAL